MLAYMYVYIVYTIYVHRFIIYKMYRHGCINGLLVDLPDGWTLALRHGCKRE